MSANKETLTITDNRTGKQYEVPIENDTIRAMDLRKIKVNDDDFGLMTYDPAFMNTASCKSSITFIDGDQGILMHRGYRIEGLTEHCDFTEVCYLLVYGKLPTKSELEEFDRKLTYHSLLHEDMKNFFAGFPATAHPMAMLSAMVASLSACHHLWYLHLCADAGVTVIAYSDDASGEMAENEDGSGQFTAVVLRPRVTITSASDRDKARMLHDDAASFCFVARSMNFPVGHEPTIIVQG